MSSVRIVKPKPPLGAEVRHPHEKQRLITGDQRERRRFVTVAEHASDLIGRDKRALLNAFAYPTISARGPAARPRCIPPACGALPASSHQRTSGPYRRSITRGRLRSPCTHRHSGRIAAPVNPLAGLEALPAPPAPNHGGPLWPVQRHSGGASKLPRDPHGQAFRRWTTTGVLPPDRA